MPRSLKNTVRIPTFGQVFPEFELRMKYHGGLFVENYPKDANLYVNHRMFALKVL